MLGIRHNRLEDISDVRSHRCYVVPPALWKHSSLAVDFWQSIAWFAVRESAAGMVSSVVSSSCQRSS